MSTQTWSFVLSWSRVGINAALFLVATRVLTLAEIGLFATAFAPIRLARAMQKAGVSDAVVMFGDKGRRWAALLALSAAFGAALAGLFATLGLMLSPMLVALSAIPLLHGLGAVPEGILRQRLALRALALRTLAAQCAAAGLALWMLWAGFGAWALVSFALANALLTNGLSILLAHWWPGRAPSWRDIRLVLPKTGQLMGRVALTTSQMPLAQLAIGLVLGPAAAGAFQIATRMFELIEALTLSPLRFIALPRLAGSADLGATLQREFRQSATLAAWVWGGTCAATVPILTLAVGREHAPAAAPILQGLALLGLASALMMPLTQALTAKGFTGLVLARAALSLGASAAFMALALTVGPAACALALSLAGGVAHLWLLQRALPRLGLPWADLAPVAPPLLAGAVMLFLLLAAPALPLLAEVVLGTGLYALTLAAFRLPRRGFA